MILSIFLASAMAFKSQVLMEIDCAGRVAMLPNTDMEMSAVATGLNPWKNLKVFADRMYLRAQCTCPGLTRSQFDDVFNVAHPHWMLSHMSRKGIDFSAVCPQGQKDFDGAFSGYLFEQDVLPAFVNVDAMMAGTPQYAEMSFQTNADMRVGVGVGLCPEKAGELRGTWFQVYMTGTDAPKLFKPCVIDADCGGSLSCKSTELWSKDDFDSVFPWLVDMGFYDEMDASPGCLSAETIFAKGMSFFSKAMFAPPVTAPTLNMCFPKDASSIDNVGKLWNEDACSNGACNNIKGDGSGAPPIPAVKPTPSISPLTQGAKVLFYYDGQKTVSVLPSFPNLAAHMTFDVRPIMTFVREIVTEMQQCRATARGTSITTAQINAFYGFVETWLQAFVVPAAKTVPDQPGMSSAFSKHLTDVTHFQLPTTCSYDTWPVCSMRWTGLSALTGLDIIINMVVREVGESASFYIECEGTGCALLDGIPCTDASACPANAQCAAVTGQLFGAGWADWMYRYNSTFSEEFGFQQVPNACRDDTVKNNADSSIFINAIVRGVAEDSKLCIPADIPGRTIDQWVEAQMITSGDTVRFNTVDVWDAPAGDPANGPVSQQDSATSVMMSSAAMILAMMAL